MLTNLVYSRACAWISIVFAIIFFILFVVFGIHVIIALAMSASGWIIVWKGVVCAFNLLAALWNAAVFYVNYKEG